MNESTGTGQQSFEGRATPDARCRLCDGRGVLFESRTFGIPWTSESHSYPSFCHCGAGLRKKAEFQALHRTKGLLPEWPE